MARSVTLFFVYTVRVSSNCDVMHYDVIWVLLCHATVHDAVVARKVLHNSPVYNVICHCQGAYGTERLWEGSLEQNKTENCSWINRACTNGSFGKRESFRGVLLKYTIFNQSPMKWPSFPWKSSYRWQYPFPYCVVCQPGCASQFRVWNRYHIMTPVHVDMCL